MKIFWTYPDIGEEERLAVEKVLDKRWLSQGEETRLFEIELSEYLSSKYTTVVSSGTGALIVALLANGVGPGDYVIVPTFTFIATATAVRSVGAIPLFVDCDRESLNISMEEVEDTLKKKKVKAVICTDVAGMPCDLEKLEELCRQYDAIFVEDAAESFGAEYKGRRVGSFNHTAIFSFHVAKTLTTVEGGCVVTNTEEIDKRCKLIRSHGMLPKGRGEYLHALFGLNFRTTDIQSAIGKAQLKKVDGFLMQRNKIAEIYKKNLRDHFNFQYVPDYVSLHPYMIFQLICASQKIRDNIRENLERNEVDYRICWKPVHLQEPFEQGLKFSNSEWAWKNSISIPIGNVMPEDLAEFVSQKIMESIN